MATRNLTILYRKYRDALKTVRVTTTSYSSSPPSSSSDAVIELVNSSLLNPHPFYKPLSTMMMEISVKAHAKALMPAFGVGIEDQAVSCNRPAKSFGGAAQKKKSPCLKRLKLQKVAISEHQMIRIKQSEAFTVAREKEIQQVAESVNELAQIMKDLSILVIDQGSIVDQIDYNIQNVATPTEEGLKTAAGMRNGACGHVLHYVGSPGPQGGILSEALKDLSTRPETGICRSNVNLCRINDKECTSDMALWAEPINGMPKCSRKPCSEKQVSNSRAIPHQSSRFNLKTDITVRKTLFMISPKPVAPQPFSRNAVTTDYLHAQVRKRPPDCYSNKDMK
ncbi:hypothetical protein RJ641_020762 [Dillenia turbinata]|uniref:t-SNARE coiled-coil homology domain-containing protein n=1 Tax=Dillenia turbinata TaxID=194707 RepID=A0AAN8YX82_9MAGN